MQIKEITDDALISDIYHIRMKKDFIRNELKPLSGIKKARADGIYSCLGAFSGDELLAYAFFVQRKTETGQDYLLDYFATAENRRGEGIGTEVMRALPEHLDLTGCIVGEVEDPALESDSAKREIKERRYNFYLNNGWFDTGVTSVVFSVPYKLIALDKSLRKSEKDAREAYAALYKSILPALFYKTSFKIND